MAVYIIGESHTRIYNAQPFNVVDLPAITMHRIARDGVNETLKHHGTFFEPSQGDIVMFVVGEVDCRCHVWKQIHENHRPEEEVLHDLATRFIAKLCDYQIKYGVKIIIRGIVPPLRDGQHHDTVYPIRGDINDRIRWRSTMNSLLESMCHQCEHMYFLPSPAWAEHNDHTMIFDKSDGIIHISNECTQEACRDLSGFIASVVTNS